MFVLLVKGNCEWNICRLSYIHEIRCGVRPLFQNVVEAHVVVKRFFYVAVREK